MTPIVLASTSNTRRSLLERAGLSVTSLPARVDETAILQGLQAEDATPRDIADTLAEHKAMRVAGRRPDDLIIGADQVLALDGAVFQKPTDKNDARDHLIALRGRTHQLLSAVVMYDRGQPVWREIGVARLTMRGFSDDYLDAYLDRNWPEIGQSVGAYQVEGEGIRLFDKIEGDYFTILGLPLLSVVTQLTRMGRIPG